jgi:endonuclease-3 related protein
MSGHLQTIRNLYCRLHFCWGGQNWWPARELWELVLGAILTQNTAWSNVERALESLRRAGRLSVEECAALSEEELAELIHSSGCYRMKARRVKEFLAFLAREHRLSLESLFALPTPELRAKLLQQKGIGPETADSMLLYGGQRELFVVDAYARRIFSRHDLCSANEEYEALRLTVEKALDKDFDPEEEAAAGSKRKKIPFVPLDPPPATHRPSPMSMAPRSPKANRFNEFHALLVQAGKHYCRKSAPLCERCPLCEFLPKNKPAAFRPPAK